METTIKLVLSILFFFCLANMSYGYYQFVRMSGAIGFSILAYGSYQQREHIATIIYIGLALLFQPIIKVALGRFWWNVVDVIVGVSLIISVLLNSKNKTQSKKG